MAPTPYLHSTLLQFKLHSCSRPSHARSPALTKRSQTRCYRSGGCSLGLRPRARSGDSSPSWLPWLCRLSLLPRSPPSHRLSSSGCDSASLSLCEVCARAASVTLPRHMLASCPRRHASSRTTPSVQGIRYSSAGCPCSTHTRGWNRRALATEDDIVKGSCDAVLGVVVLWRDGMAERLVLKELSVRRGCDCCCRKLPSCAKRAPVCCLMPST